MVASLPTIAGAKDDLALGIDFGHEKGKASGTVGQRLKLRRRQSTEERQCQVLHILLGGCWFAVSKTNCHPRPSTSIKSGQISFSGNSRIFASKTWRIR